jgi:hypothetical protein
VDRVLGPEVAEAPQLLVEAAERRALVAGDERRRVEPARDVGAALVEQHAHQRLDPRQEHRALLEHVLVLKRGLRPAELRRPLRADVRDRQRRRGHSVSLLRE